MELLMSICLFICPILSGFCDSAATRRICSKTSLSELPWTADVQQSWPFANHAYPWLPTGQMIGFCTMQNAKTQQPSGWCTPKSSLLDFYLTPDVQHHIMVNVPLGPIREGPGTKNLVWHLASMTYCSLFQIYKDIWIWILSFDVWSQVPEKYSFHSHHYIEGILPKGPYPPCLRMADKALLAGYPSYVQWTSIIAQYNMILNTAVQWLM